MTTFAEAFDTDWGVEIDELEDDEMEILKAFLGENGDEDESWWDDEDDEWVE